MNKRRSEPKNSVPNDPKATEQRRLQRRQRLLALVRLPMASGRVSAAVLFACLVATAVLVPMTLRLPAWIDIEIVLGLWWLIWVAALTVLLHAGRRLSDDHQLQKPRSWFGKDMWNFLDWVPAGNFSVGDEGCLGTLGLLLLLIVAIPLLLLAIWFLVEIALPAIAFLTYFLVRGMLARVVNDRRGCKGDLPRALLWGGLWATLYTAPLAGLVWFVHRIALTNAAG